MKRRNLAYAAAVFMVLGAVTACGKEQEKPKKESNTEATVSEETTTAAPETAGVNLGSYQFKNDTLKPIREENGAVKLEIPFIQQDAELKGGMGNAITCAAMILSAYGSEVNASDVEKEYLAYTKEHGVSGQLYQYVNPREEYVPAKSEDLTNLTLFLKRVGVEGQKTYLTCQSTSGRYIAEQYTKNYMKDAILEGSIVYTLGTEGNTADGEKTVILVVGFDDEKGTYLVAEPTKDGLTEKNQEEFHQFLNATDVPVCYVKRAK